MSSRAPEPESFRWATEMHAPASEEEVVAFVREAHAARRPFTTIGRGTKSHHGPLTPENGVPRATMTLRNLDRITACEPGDLVVSVQAGVRLADLQATLAPHRLWLPLDPPYADATMGGILATASAGPRRLGYGTARDLLLGLRVAGPDGLVTRAGGRVVKNVTGYDLHKLHVGGFGSLGVLLEAHFKVRPLPELSGAVVLACSDLATAHRLLLDVWGSPLRPVALEALDAAAAADLRACVGSLPVGDAIAVVGVEGSRAVFERHVRDLEAYRSRVLGLAVVQGPAAGDLWAAFRDMPDGRRREVTVRLGGRPHDLPEVLRIVAAAPTTGISVHVGNGIARVRLGPHAVEIAKNVRSWHDLAAACGGYAVVEAAPPDLAGRSELPWGTASHSLGRALKQRWDPNQIMNPGRMAP